MKKEKDVLTATEEPPAAATEKAGVLNINDILRADDTQYATIDVPEWGGAVRVGSLPAGDMIEWAEQNQQPNTRRSAAMRLLVKSIVDADGRRIGKPEHIELFRNKDHSVIARVVKQILILNKLSDPEKKDGEGNESSEALTGVSPTVLH